MFKKICSLIFSTALAFVAVVPAFGQAGERLVWFPSVKVSELSVPENLVAGENIKGSIKIENFSDRTATEMTLKVNILYENAKKQKSVVYSEDLVGEFVIAPKSGLTREFEFVLPRSLYKDNLSLDLLVYHGGKMVSGEVQKNVVVTGQMSPVNMLSGYILLSNGKKTGLTEGPMIYKDRDPKTAELLLTIENSDTKEVSVTPSVRVRKWNPNDKEGNWTDVKSNEGGVSLKTKEKKEVRVSLPTFDYAPGVYEGRLDFLDETGVSRSSPYSFRYVISGDIATVGAITSNKNSVKKGDVLNVSFDVGGVPGDILSTDNQNVYGDHQVKVIVKNEIGRTVGETSMTLKANDAGLKYVTLSAEKDAKALIAKIEVVSSEGKVLAEKTTKLSADFDKIQFNYYKKAALVGLLSLVVAIILIALLWKNRKRFLKIGAIAVFALVASLTFTQTADAGALVFSSRNLTNSRCPDPGISISFSGIADNQEFNPGEQFTVYGYYTYSSCANSAVSGNAAGYILKKSDAEALVIPASAYSTFSGAESRLGIAQIISDSGKTSSVLSSVPYVAWLTGSGECATPGCSRDTPNAELGTFTVPNEPGEYRFYFFVHHVNGCYNNYVLQYIDFKVKPHAPTNLVVGNLSCSLLDVPLSWTASVTQGVTYNVYKSATTFTSTTASGVTKVSSNQTGTTFTDHLTDGRPKDYYYAVTAEKDGSESALSNVIKADFNCLAGVCGAGAGDRTTVPSASDTNLCSNSFASSFVGPTLVNGIRRYSWICKGEIASEDVTCLADVTFNGECGTLDGQTNVPQSTNLTADGVLCASHGGVEITSPTNSRNLTWKCKGSDSSKDVSCSATMTGTPTLNPSCGPFADGRQLGLGKVITDFPPEQLCSIGAPVDFTTEKKSNSEGWYRWQCISQNKTAVCSAPYFRAPAVCSTVENECESGYFMEGTTADTSSVHYWECNNRSDGTGSKASCSINLNEAGCGDANGGNFEATPSADLCLPGSTASAVTSSSNNLYWNWSCSKGTSIKSCQADKASVATPVISATGWCPATPNGKANIDVHVSSDAGVSPITFNIYRSNTSSTVATTSANLVGTLSGSRDSLLTFTDVDKNTNSTYYYRVVATNSVGTAPTSPTVEVRTPSCIITPQGITTTAAAWCSGTSPKVGLLAHAQSGTVPVTHKVYRGTTSGFTPNLGSPILTISQSSLEVESNSYSEFDNNVVLGNTYYYKVVSSNSGGEVTSSEFSVTVPATCSGGGDNFCPGTTTPVPASGECPCVSGSCGGGNGHNGPGPTPPTTCPNGDPLPSGGVCQNECLIIDPANPNPACTVALNPIAASPLRINKGENCSISFAGSFGAQSYNSDTVCAFKTPAQTIFKFHPSNPSEAGPYSNGVYTAVGLQAETTYTLECWQEDKNGVKVGASQTASATCYINPSNVETSFLQKLKNGFTKAVGAIIFWNK